MQRTLIAFGLVALPSDLARRLDRVCKRLGMEPGAVVGLAVYGAVAGLEADAQKRGAKWCLRFRSKGGKS